MLGGIAPTVGDPGTWPVTCDDAAHQPPTIPARHPPDQIAGTNSYCHYVGMPDLSDSVTIEAPVETVYAMVSDLPRMGEWSPENRGAIWRSKTAGPALGATFIGHNKAGWLRWPTQGRVTAADPGREFAFEIYFGPIPVAVWAYEFSPADDGVTVTETWTDRRPTWLKPMMDAPFRAPRTELNARGIRKTLANLKRAAETT
jgi:hypothetical protein